jgi:hypothetical protein
MIERFILVAMLGACVGEPPPDVDGDDAVDDGEPGDDTGDEVDESCLPARSYAGFDGAPLEANRAVMVAGSDRLRTKPYAALASEYDRALGLTGTGTREYAATFGQAPDRWFTEPLPSASTLYASFAIAYRACTQLVGSTTGYEQAPTPSSADVICRERARVAWGRDATDVEAAACVDFAVAKTLATDPPAKRWAYTCAAVLTAADFLTY